MTLYKIDFEKTVWGFAYIDAENKEEARKKFEDGEIDGGYDNDSEYEWGTEIYE